MVSTDLPTEPVDADSFTTTHVVTPVFNGAGAIDSSHPYYLHPSDYPWMNLVSSVFDGKSYGGWRRAVVIALSAKIKLGFIDGTLVVPSSDSGLQKAWARCNDMVLSWLLNSLSKEIAESVLYSQSAKDLWGDLEDRFGQTNGAKLFQQQKELSAVIQGNTSVSTYFTKMKSLWDELDALNTFSACVCEYDCGAKSKSLKAHQDERLLQFLMGLNECFIGVRSNILLSSTLPSIGQAYSLVIQDEKQREIHATPIYQGESGSFVAANYAGRGKKIHGFPEDFKFTKQKKFQPISQANNAFNLTEAVEQGINCAPDVKTLTQENVTQLLQLLQQVNMNQNQQNADTSDVFANFNCSGISKYFNSYAYYIQVDSHSWIIDSGASEHMTFNKAFLPNFKALSRHVIVNLPNSCRFKVTHYGSVTLFPNVVLQKGPLLKSPLEIGTSLSQGSMVQLFLRIFLSVVVL
ncbi:uncharacterized protein [Nicotiana sylvestris]|uniref:uncharacterized protein n=1 Tax=Nicotiana sylvestris TaxID=4096 RepID=UPI00388CC73D